MQKRVIRSFFNRLYASDFVRNVLKLFSGTMVTQIVMIIMIPVLTFLFTPEDFALLAFYVGVTTFFGVMMAGRYEFSLMLPEDEIEASHLLVLSIGLTIILSLVFLFFISLAQDTLIRSYSNLKISKIIYLIPLGTFLFSIKNIGDKWSSRKKRFGLMAWSKISLSLTQVFIQLILGYFLSVLGGTSLVIGYISGLALSVVVIYFSIFSDVLKIWKKIRLYRIWNLSVRYKKFPVFSMPSGVLSQAAHQMPNFVLPYFGAGVLGNYMLCDKLLNAPLGFLGMAISNVFFEKISRLRHDLVRTKKLLIDAYKFLLITILPIMTILFFCGADILPYFLGEEWAGVGVYIKILIPFVTVKFLVSPTALSMQAFEKQDVIFIWMLAYSSLSAAIFWFGYLHSTAIHTILLYSLLSALMYLIWITLSLKLIDSKEK